MYLETFYKKTKEKLKRDLHIGIIQWNKIVSEKPYGVMIYIIIYKTAYALHTLISFVVCFLSVGIK